VSNVSNLIHYFTPFSICVCSNKEGWNAGITDGKKGNYKIKFGHDMHGYSAKVVDKVDKININMEKM
jgi:hypothetical protein